jgi:hypothetical protein
VASYKEVRVRPCDPSIKDAEGFRGNSLEFTVGDNAKKFKLVYAPGEDSNPYFDFIEYMMSIDLGLLKALPEDRTEEQQCMWETKQALIKKWYKELIACKAMLKTLRQMSEENPEVLELALSLKLAQPSSQIQELIASIKGA